MENSHRFFENKSCKYYPCHNDMQDINCLFCYCPLYHMKHCPGTPNYIQCKEKPIKECSNCTFPHRPENWEEIVKLLGE